MSNNPPRLSVENAVGRYKESTGLGKLPPGMVKDFTFEKYGEEVRYLLPGMIGAMLKLDLKSISAPEIGSALPIMVLRYPVLRIILDPELTEYDTYVFVHASNYSGDGQVRQRCYGVLNAASLGIVGCHRSGHSYLDLMGAILPQPPPRRPLPKKPP
jgi:hypothetical protein